MAIAPETTDVVRPKRQRWLAMGVQGLDKGLWSA